MSLTEILLKYDRLCRRLSNKHVTVYFSREEIVEIHEQVMDEFGDGEEISISNEEALNSLEWIPYTTESQPYGLYHTAVEYIGRCAQKKPFKSGNTLTGVILALEFLSQNGTEWRGDIVLLECLARRFESTPDMDVFFGLELFLKATHG